MDYNPPLQPVVLNLAFGAENSPNICWVCGTQTALEEHHMIPRAYGGQDGPVICLCAVCHSNTHKLADASGKEKPTLQLAQSIAKTTNKISLTRLQQLAIIILQSKQITVNDKNKTAVYIDRFEAQTLRELKELAKVYQLNQKQLVRLAIRTLHQKTFMQR